MGMWGSSNWQRAKSGARVLPRKSRANLVSTAWLWASHTSPGGAPKRPSSLSSRAFCGEHGASTSLLAAPQAEVDPSSASLLVEVMQDATTCSSRCLLGSGRR
eukprot:scaffold244627_cov26-Tisochrysis_lutea.AAC.2